MNFQVFQNELKLKQKFPGENRKWAYLQLKHARKIRVKDSLTTSKKTLKNTIWYCIAT